MSADYRDRTTWRAGQGRDRAARRPQQDVVRAGPAAQPRSTGDGVARAAARLPRHTVPARAARRQGSPASISSRPCRGCSAPTRSSSSSDIGVVTKLSPGQMLMFAADRFTGEPKPGCDVQVLASQKAMGGGQDRGRRRADGATAGGQARGHRRHRPLRRSDGRRVTGQLVCQRAAARAGRLHLHRQADLSTRAIACTSRPCCAGASATRCSRSIGPTRRSASPTRTRRSCSGSRSTSTPSAPSMRRSRCPPPRRSATTAFACVSGEAEANGGFEVQEYRRPEFEVIVSPQSRFVVQGNDAVATVQARYYFGQPVANAKRPLRRESAGLLLAAALGRRRGGRRGRRLLLRRRPARRGRDSARCAGHAARSGCRSRSTKTATTTARGSKRKSWMRAAAKSAATRSSMRRTGRFSSRRSRRTISCRIGQQVGVSLRTLDYTGEPRGDVPLTVTLLDASRIQTGAITDPTLTEVGDRDGHDRRPTARRTSASQARRSPVRIACACRRRTKIARSRPRRGSGCPARPPNRSSARAISISSCSPTSAATHRARRRRSGHPRRASLWPGPGHQGRPARHLAPRGCVPAAGDAIDVPIDSGDVGDIYVNIVFMREGRLYRAERRVVGARERSRAADHADGRPSDREAAGAWRVHGATSRMPPARPRQAQVSLGVIDEAVYAIRQDDTPDPVRLLLSPRIQPRRHRRSRATTTSPGSPAPSGCSWRSRKRRPFTLADFKGDKQVQPQVRKDFPDAIYWIGDLVTDASGQAKVSIKYPDALTTWRLTARAVTRDTKAGAAVARTTTTKDLIVRVITPRFLTEGDQVVAANNRAQLPARRRRTRASRSRRRAWTPILARRRRRRRAASRAAANDATTGGCARRPWAPRP